MSLRDEFIYALVNLDESRAIELARRAVESVDPLEILDWLRVAADVIGEKYERGEFLLLILYLLVRF